jgi:Protein of unknown function (DUF4056)
MPENPKRGPLAPPSGTEVPGLAPPTEPIPVSDITPVRGPKHRDVKILSPDRLVASGGSNAYPRKILAEKSANVLAPVETVGKVRLRLRAESGLPRGDVAFRILARTAASAELVVIATGIADLAGYASVNLSGVAQNRVAELIVEFESSAAGSTIAPAFQVSIGRAHFATHRDAGIPHDIVLPASAGVTVRTGAENLAARLDDPDAQDLANSPESFSFATANVDGTCCLKPTAELAARQFFFNQLVRLEAPDLVAGSRVLARRDVRGPIPFGDGGPSTFLPHAGEPVLGKLNVYRHAWFPAARGLGELLYSLPLAPCEQVKLAVIDWSRDEESTRREELFSSERLQHETHRDRTVEEAVSAVLHEEQSGASATLGVGLSLSLGDFSLGGGGGGAASSSAGVRQLQESTVQQIADAVTQQSSVLRTQRATVVTTSAQRESERIQTRVVHNHNRNHAMTVQYFQVLSHYRVRTELVEEQPVVMVPYAIEADVYDEVPEFDALKKAPARPITRFLDRHKSVLGNLTPRKYAGAYDALSRLLHSGDAYQNDAPYATGSRWRVTMNQACRPGVTLEIETTDGQNVEIRPRVREGPTGTAEFLSDPIDLATIDRLRIGFDPTVALDHLPTGLSKLQGDSLAAALAQLATFTLSRCELHVRTDRSRFLDRPQQYRVPIQVAETTLSAAHPSASFDLTPPAISFDRYVGQHYRDYCLVKELIAYVQSDPMRFLRAIWMAENRDRRAIRLDRFAYAGQPLLDQIENRPVGVFGNLVAFPLLEGHRFVPASPADIVFSERLVSVPTPGVFAEVFLSCCNATEVRDVTRTIDPASCGMTAPDIAPVAAGSRRDRADTTPSAFAAPVVGIQTPAALPDPSGLGAALAALTASNVFRDMSLGTNLLSFIGAATAGAQLSTREAQQQQAALASQLLAGSLGVPTPAGTGGAAAPAFPNAGGGSPSSPTGSPQPSLRPGPPIPAPSQLTVPPNQGLQVAHSQLARQTPAPQLFDHVNAIRNAASSGLLTPNQVQQATNALFGGDLGSQNVILAALPTTSPLPEPNGRNCCAIGFDIAIPPTIGPPIQNVQDLTTLKPHKYNEVPPVVDRDNGLVYTCRGGVIDTGHVRECADYTAFFAVKAMELNVTGGSVTLAKPEFGSTLRKVIINTAAGSFALDHYIAIGMRISYEFAIWHEIETWFQVGGFVPERYSAFSPEDNYSNLLGTYIARDALLDSRPYDEAMTAAITRILTALGAVTSTQARAALKTVEGRWWDNTKVLPDLKFLLRRHMEPFGTVTPWLLASTACVAGVTPLSLPVPEFSPSDGSLLSDHYELQITVDTTKIPATVLPDPARTTITPADFPSIVAQVHAQVLTEFGIDGDQP